MIPIKGFYFLLSSYSRALELVKENERNGKPASSMPKITT